MLAPSKILFWIRIVHPTPPNLPVKLGSHLSTSSSFLIPSGNPLPSLLCLLGFMLWHLSHEIMTICLCVWLSPALRELPEDRDCIHRPLKVTTMGLMTKADGEWIKNKIKKDSDSLHYQGSPIWSMILQCEKCWVKTAIVFLMFQHKNKHPLIWNPLFIHNTKPLKTSKILFPNNERLGLSFSKWHGQKGITKND